MSHVEIIPLGHAKPSDIQDIQGADNGMDLMLLGKIAVKFAKQAFVILAADFVVDQAVCVEKAGAFSPGQQLQAFTRESDASVRYKRNFTPPAGVPVFGGGFAQ
jgi:hypothetical protein